MKIYLVGGAVRDKLLGRKPKEYDWVVVGSSPKELLAKGFQQVGKDFPVFLHPESKEEYALARTERKTGPGYHGFACDFHAGVSLVDDLKRRDLTINAIAQTADGQLIDPFGGVADIQQHQLRHVSPAFSEDPLRILRLARFYAELSAWQFQVTAETKSLVAEMVRQNQLQELVPERVWQEIKKALQSPSPGLFWQFLHDMQAQSALWPGWEKFPFLDWPILAQAGELALESKWLLHWLIWWQFYQPQPTAGLKLIQQAQLHLKTPRRIQQTLQSFFQAIAYWPNPEQTEAEILVKILKSFAPTQSLALWQTMMPVITLCWGNAARWQSLIDCWQQVNANPYQGKLTGEAIGQAMEHERIERITALQIAWREKM